MPIKGITLIELLVVIAMIGVLAGVVGPNISGWNCRQEVRNDFDKLNIFLEKLRAESFVRNRQMMAQIRDDGVNGSIKVYMGPANKGKNCSGGGWSYRGGSVGDIPDYWSEKSRLSYLKGAVCFYSDGSATATPINRYAYTISRQCDGKNYQFRNSIFGATGLINKEKYNTTTSKWDEL